MKKNFSGHKLFFRLENLLNFCSSHTYFPLARLLVGIEVDAAALGGRRLHKVHPHAQLPQLWIGRMAPLRIGGKYNREKNVREGGKCWHGERECKNIVEILIENNI